METTVAPKVSFEALLTEAQEALRRFARMERGNPVLHASDWKMWMGRCASSTVRKNGLPFSEATPIYEGLQPMLDEVRLIQAGSGPDDSSISTFAKELIELTEAALSSDVPFRIESAAERMSDDLKMLKAGDLPGQFVILLAERLAERVSQIVLSRPMGTRSVEELDRDDLFSRRAHDVKNRAREMGPVFDAILESDRAKLKALCA
jgi:hypothetical protein